MCWLTLSQAHVLSGFLAVPTYRVAIWVPRLLRSMLLCLVFHTAHSQRIAVCPWALCCCSLVPAIEVHVDFKSLDHC